MKKKVVVVTGFGPFQNHKVNASWEAVEALTDLTLGDDICLVTEKVSVQYNTVEKRIPELWDQLKPDLVVHVGVSSIAETVVVEKYAHSFGYNKEDITGSLPHDQDKCAVECLETTFNLDKLCKYCHDSGSPCKVLISEEAGRYLCEYIYYMSMRMHRGPVLFVHVPCLQGAVTKDVLAEALVFIIRGCLIQIG